MATENAISYLNGKWETMQDRTLKGALVLSVVLHGVTGVWLFQWQPEQKLVILSPETKIQVKLANQPLLQPQIQTQPQLARSIDMTRVPQSVPLDRSSPETKSSVAAAQLPSAEPIASTPVVAPSPGVTETVAKASAPVARANAADVIAAFLARLEQRKEYPYIARKRGQTGTVTIQVRIGPAGELREATIVAASGVARLDEAAIELVRRSCPFRHDTGEELRMTVPIVYDLKE